MARSVANPTIPPACSRLRSRRAFSCGERSSPAGSSEAGSASSSSCPVSTCSCHRQVTGSAPPWLRRKATRLPSGATLNERGTPRENRLVRACCRGKLSVMAPILPPWPATRGRQLVSLPVSTPETGGGLLVVHAHPDDESIETGATMARYAAAGVPVTLVTCTLGELGEIIPADLAYLGAERGDLLGKYRIGELEAACAALGVRDHRFLGGPGRWRDSGMMGLPSNDDPGCFWQADLDEAALDLVAIIREVRPRVMVSYDDRGFYGHPDHIQAHRVAWRAFQLAGDPGLSSLVSLGPGSRGPAPGPARVWPPWARR